MSWSRVSKVDEMVKIGDQVKVKVLKIDRTARKLTLGLKQLTPSPWEAATEKYPRGMMVKGKVSKIMDFGAVRRARARDRGLDPHLRAVADPRAQGRGYRQARAGGRGPHPQGRARGQEDRSVSVAGQGDARCRGGEDDADDDETPPPPEPEPKIPLKGGLGDRERRSNR